MQRHQSLFEFESYWAEQQQKSKSKFIQNNISNAMMTLSFTFRDDVYKMGKRILLFATNLAKKVKLFFTIIDDIFSRESIALPNC
jgi:hypothetical protein